MGTETVRAAMMAFWLAHGAQPYQAEALVHQASIESGLQPCARSRMGSWLYGWVGSRRAALARAAGTAGCPPLQAQLRFALDELRALPYKGFWRSPPGTAFADLRACYGRGHCGGG